MKNNHINYVEFRAKNIDDVKRFYSAAFGWTFTDYGSTYTAFSESGLQGGFDQSDDEVVTGALVILFHENLEACLEMVKESGGRIAEEIFSFPGGRRFHFQDPAGNELAVWSDK